MISMGGEELVPKIGHPNPKKRLLKTEKATRLLQNFDLGETIQTANTVFDKVLEYAYAGNEICQQILVDVGLARWSNSTERYNIVT